MDNRSKPSQKVQKAIDDAKLALSAALGVAGFLFVPFDEWGACYFFMVAAMAVSTLSSMSTALRESEAESKLEGTHEEEGNGDSADESEQTAFAPWPFAAV
jgi:hypothetical protein